MLFRNIANILGFYFLSLTGVLLIPLGVAIYFQFFVDPALHPQPHSTIAFAETAGICLLIAIALKTAGRQEKGTLFRREGLFAVAIIWFFTPAIGALPFYLSGTFDSYLDSYFEATSGFSTTGITMMEAKAYNPITGSEIPITRSYCGTHDTTYTYYGTITPVRNPETGKPILTGIEAVSSAVLFWRSMTQWLGGLGIIVLFVALLPALGAGGKFLLQTELPGPLKDALTPRIKETAIALWKIYLSLSVIEVILLLSLNPEMTWFEAVTLTFSTLSTGGFSVHGSSVGYFQDSYTETVILIFMFLGSMNFALYYYLIRGKLYRFYDAEFLLYLVLLIGFSFFTISDLIDSPRYDPSGNQIGVFGVKDAVRYGIFQMVSAQTSTGFTTYNYTTWPYLAQALMLVVMYFGGMSGSTAGGMKTMRQYLLFRIAQNKIELLFRPETVRSFRINNREVDLSVANLVLCFFLVIISFSVLGTLLYIMNGIDPQTSLGLVACNVNNIGISFLASGPPFSAAFLPSFSQIISILLMILGRLEFFALLVLLVPAFWQEEY